MWYLEQPVKIYLCVQKQFHGPQGHYAQWEKPILKGHTLYDSIYITFSKWKKNVNMENRLVAKGQKWGDVCMKIRG